MLQLGQVMTKRVVTLPETKTTRDAARLMHKHGIGSVVVTHGGRVVGLVTESDLLKVVAKGQRVDKVLLKDMMTQPVVVGHEKDPLEEAVKLMVLHNVKKLPIMRGKRLVGIVTLTDFARVEPLYHDMFQRHLERAHRETKRKFQKYLTPREAPAVMYG